MSLRTSRHTMPVRLETLLKEWTQRESSAHTENVELSGKFMRDLRGKVTLTEKGKEWSLRVIAVLVSREKLDLLCSLAYARHELPFFLLGVHFPEYFSCLFPVHREKKLRDVLAKFLGGRDSCPVSAIV